ncbi:MAG: PaaI family thioesterase [Thermodesulfobacteriota bacterium]|nr:PaaI family thioesterase [Thermodesulfobacteriota bacterium]
MVSEEEKINIGKFRGLHCFACGTANPIGLDLQFYRNGNAVCSDITLGRNYEGWQNMAHGGIISTILDELMSWTILYFEKVFFVTRKMEIKYIRPVLIGEPFVAKANLIETSKSSSIKAKGEIRDNRQRILAKSTGEFVVLPKEKLSTVPEGLKEDMMQVIQAF